MGVSLHSLFTMVAAAVNRNTAAIERNAELATEMGVNVVALTQAIRTLTNYSSSGGSTVAATATATEVNVRRKHIL